MKIKYTYTITNRNALINKLVDIQTHREKYRDHRWTSNIAVLNKGGKIIVQEGLSRGATYWKFSIDVLNNKLIISQYTTLLYRIFYIIMYMMCIGTLILTRQCTNIQSIILWFIVFSSPMIFNNLKAHTLSKMMLKKFIESEFGDCITK